MKIVQLGKSNTSIDNIGQSTLTIYDTSNDEIKNMNSEDLLAELQIQRKFYIVIYYLKEYLTFPDVQ